MTPASPVQHDRVLFALRARAPALGACVLAGAIAHLSAIPIGIILGRVIDASSHSLTNSGTAVLTGAGGIGLLALLRALCKWWRVALGERIAQGVLAEVRLRMFAHLHRLPLRKLARKDPGRSVVRFAGDAMSLRSWLAGTLVDTPADALLVLGVLLSLATVHVYLLGAVALPLALCVPLVIFINPRIAARTRDARREQSALAAQVVGSLRNAPDVRRSGMIGSARRTVLGALQRARRSTVDRSRLEGALDAAVLAATSFGMAGIAAVGAWLLARDAVSAGQLVTAAWLTGLLSAPAARLARANIMHTRARVARERIAALFAQPAEHRNPPTTPLQLDHVTRLRLNRLALRLPGGATTIALDHTLRGPGLVTLRASPDASHALFNALQRKDSAFLGKIGINRRRISRYPRSELRDAVVRVNGATDTPLSIPRACRVLYVEVPASLPSRRAADVLAWARAQASTRLVLVAGPDVAPSPEHNAQHIEIKPAPLTSQPTPSQDSHANQRPS